MYFCRNHGLRVHRPTVTTVTPRTYITIYFIQPPSSPSTPSPPPAAHDQQDAASHTCRPRRYPGVLARLERDPPVDPIDRRPRRPFPEPSPCTDEGSYISGGLLMKVRISPTRDGPPIARRSLLAPDLRRNRPTLLMESSITKIVLLIGLYRTTRFTRTRIGESGTLIYLLTS